MMNTISKHYKRIGLLNLLFGFVFVAVSFLKPLPSYVFYVAVVVLILVNSSLGFPKDLKPQIVRARKQVIQTRSSYKWHVIFIALLLPLTVAAFVYFLMDFPFENALFLLLGLNCFAVLHTNNILLAEFKKLRISIFD